MDENISNLSKSLGCFCNHLEGSCQALKESVQRRPIPLDSASSTFVQCLSRRVTCLTSDVNLLDSMSFGTVSFEELLGHCSEVYKNNQTNLLELQDRLKGFGYVPELEVDDEDEDSSLSTTFGLGSKDGVDARSPASVARSFMKSLDEDPLLDESLSLKNLGLSDVCLATLASEGDNKTDDPDIGIQKPMKSYGDKLDMKDQCQRAAKIKGEQKDKPKSFEASGPIIKVSKVDYESLPSYMKSLAPWEDLLAAVDKINSSLSQKERAKGYSYFLQDEITSLGLGPKARVYLLLLMRLNRLVVETIDGVISYRLC
ncbi:hypothetical protein KPL70_018368 [Citrus sinensis]|uniref:uncharacterized protein LOC102619318 isoform X1 n=1 Tax=Citrus sinensis TaxID=2711 RepID=UPI0003D70AFE|nr:uncharacterized protein LOC102619318 isoform X1 [Citrus sinensis]KAH9674169.1 hypothetical protein KPL70_018368 [Citrus sinensis]